MAKSVKETITVKKSNGEEVVLDVLYPSGKVHQQAGLVRAAKWNEAFQAGVIIKDQLDEVLKAKGIWDEEKEKQKEEIYREIAELDRRLAAGRMRLTEGKELSLQIFKKRSELYKLLERRSEVEAETAESLAENAKFDYMVSACTVYNKDGSKYFKGIDDYIDRRTEPEAIQAATKLAAMIYSGFTEDIDENRREVKFLKKYKMMNDKGQLLNSDGKAVDEEGRLIDEENRYINEVGEYVDRDGKHINKDGSPFLEEEPVFFDDDGEVIKD